MKLVIYGDSFAAPGTEKNTPGWTEILSKNMGLSLYNNAVNGGSTDKAMLNFMHDIRENKIDSDDIIIFVKSTPGRLHLLYQNEHPWTASAYVHEVDEDDPQHRWYRKNKKHILWYLTNSDRELFCLQHEAYVHTLKSFAVANPNNIVVLLNNSPHHVSIPGIENIKNFLNPKIYLNQLSNKEYIDPNGDHAWWIKYTRYDIRENHLCIPNLKIMANLVQEMIETKNADNITYDKFESKIYDRMKNLNDYEYWIEKGYFYDIPFRRRWFKK